jgi:hypothetical protein
LTFAETSASAFGKRAVGAGEGEEMERAGELAAKRRRKEELADCGQIQGTDPSIHAVSSS